MLKITKYILEQSNNDIDSLIDAFTGNKKTNNIAPIIDDIIAAAIKLHDMDTLLLIDEHLSSLNDRIFKQF